MFLVSNLQSPSSNFTVFLASTQVGGVGLTLTAADRVVMIDPSWNPSIDHQAIDRSFRVGQKRDVVAYRLVATGLIEEKMFRYQVFKQGLAKSCLTSSSAEPRINLGLLFDEDEDGDGRLVSATRATSSASNILHEQARYFSDKDIHDLFEFLDPEKLDTCNRLQEKHGVPEKVTSGHTSSFQNQKSHKN